MIISSPDMHAILLLKPENLPPSEDIKKLERRVKNEDKKLAERSGKLNE